MKTKLLFIFVMFFLMTGSSGCGNWMCDNLGWFCPETITNNPEFNTGEDISQAHSIVEKSTKEIKNATTDISKETQEIKREIYQTKEKIPAELKKEINLHLDKINNSSNIISEKTQDINKSVAELAGATSLLNNAGDKITTIEKTLDQITKERDAAIIARDKALAAKNSQLHKALRWLIVGCIVASAGLGVFGFMYGSKLSLTLSAAAIVIMSVAIFVETYFIVVVIFGGIVLIGLIGALVYNIIIQKKAFSQVVETVEVAKTGLSSDKKIELFGDTGKTGIMDSVQSPETIKMVKKEKAKMSLWNSVKNKINKE